MEFYRRSNWTFDVGSVRAMKSGPLTVLKRINGKVLVMFNKTGTVVLTTTSSINNHTVNDPKGTRSPDWNVGETKPCFPHWFDFNEMYRDRRTCFNSRPDYEQQMLMRHSEFDEWIGNVDVKYDINYDADDNPIGE